jgi:hypothetical protein
MVSLKALCLLVWVSVGFGDALALVAQVQATNIGLTEKRDTTCYPESMEVNKVGPLSAKSKSLIT